MDDNLEVNLKKYHSSLIVPQTPEEAQAEATCKSELNVTPPNTFSVASRFCDNVDGLQNNIFREYYKRYEHDEIPVKDSNENNVRSKGSLTNSDLDKLEMKLFRNYSQQLQTDDGAVSGLESNIKFFKTTVQEIFDNFYTSMQDFDLYKKRFQEILNKNQEDSIAYMEDFIKDMIQHIMSSETISNHSRKTTDLSLRAFTETDINVSEMSVVEGLCTGSNLTTGTNCVLEAYKNENYQTDSTLDSSNGRHSIKEQKYNSIFLKSAPCLHTEISDRNLPSKIKTKNPIIDEKSGGHIVSADNIQKFAAKRLEMEKYFKHRQGDTPDVEIPVKVSYAKKNIYLNEDFMRVSSDSKQSLLSKICNFLCKRCRKNSFG